MSSIVLITGGTGLLGSRLTELLQQKDCQVRYLSRSPGKVNDVEAFVWNVDQQIIDAKALEGVDYIVHLAGAGVAEGRWTKERKKIIFESRTRSTALLRGILQSQSHQVKAVIGASGIGYYGNDSGGVVKKEGSRFGDDFLATVTKEWEAEEDKIVELGIRVVKIRTGIVLSSDGGALKEIAKPIKLGAGAPLGSGDQFMSWIHIDDLCNIFIHAIEHEEMSGPYNAVAPNPVTNKEFTKATANALGKPLFLPAVPAFALKLALGEMASMVLGGSRVSSERIEEAGFKFNYTELQPALDDLLKNNKNK